MDYNVIYDFCKIRNNGTAMENGLEEYPPRVKFLLNLIESLGLDYEVDSFLHKSKRTKLHNIYLRGSSNNWVMAHHDVCNHRIDNANDNSASVINAIGLKTIRPDINIALVDGEEPPLMGAGSSHFGRRVTNGEINVNWVLNLELSGSGGTNFFIGNYKTPLTNAIKNKFGCAVMNVPFNDATILINNEGINAALINPCPLKEGTLVVTQIGIANDVIKEYLSKSKKGYDDFKIDMQDFDGNMDDFLDSYEDEWDFFEEDGDLFLSEVKLGDTFDKSKLKYFIEDLKRAGYDPKSEQEKFKVEIKPIEIGKGKMPTLDQMDTSILYRCHTPHDTVDKISPEDMKEFVEKVLVVICEL